MEILNLQQGTPEWHAERLRCFTASEAPAMMGASKHMNRTELLDLKKSGIDKEVDSYTQKIFDKGHATEEMARPIIEAMIGEDLYPVTGKVVVDELQLLASFDGLTLMHDIGYEHKQWNNDVATKLESGEIGPQHYWQLEQQLLVSGADKIIFTVSDGTQEKLRHLEYEAVPGRREQLIAGWKQFAADLEAHEVTETKAAPVAEVTESLPAVSVQVSGEISIIGNLDKFGEALKAYTENMNMKPETDQDFVNLEAAGKSLQKAEDALTAAENNALSQVASVEEMRRAVSEYRELARSFRLKAEKAVKAEKENRKKAIVTSATNALHEHIEKLTDELEGYHLPLISADFAGSIKGKRSLASMQDAVDTTLAHAKIEADGYAKTMRDNLHTINEQAADYRFLFNDLQAVIHKPTDDFAVLVQHRVTQHMDAERQREERERERIRDEEIKRIEEERQRQREVYEKATASSGDSSSDSNPSKLKAETSHANSQRNVETVYVSTLYSVTVVGPDNLQIELPGGRKALCLDSAIKLRDNLDAAIDSI